MGKRRGGGVERQESLHTAGGSAAANVYESLHTAGGSAAANVYESLHTAGGSAAANFRLHF